MSQPYTDGGPAFPMPVGAALDQAHTWNSSNEGMSLRDWFAGQFLSGLAAGGSVKLPFVENYQRGPIEAARLAYAFADAMLAVRGQKTEGGGG